MNPDAPASTPPLRRSLEYCAFVLAFLLSFFAVTRNYVDADLWGHVQYGRDYLSEGHLPATATYTYTSEGYPWTNHENLAEISFALIDGWFGAIGLMIAKSILVYGMLWLVIRTAVRQQVGLATLSAGLLVIAINLTFHLGIRPQLFTYFFFTLMLALLGWCFHGWEGNWQVMAGRWGASEPPQYSSRRLRFLWCGLPLFWVWANTHGGFLAGLFVWIAYLGLRGVEAWSFKGRAATGLLLRLAMMIGAAVLGTLINPYGPRLHGWLLRALGTPRPEISEWHPPVWGDPMSAPFWLLLSLLVVTLVMTRRSRDFTQLGVMLLLVLQGLSHQRHACFVTLGFAFWYLPHLDSVLQRVRAHEWFWLRSWSARPTVRYVGIGVSAVGAALVAWHTAGRLTDLKVGRDEFPVAAVQYMSDRGLEGNLVAHFDWAQYLIAALGARDVGQRGIRLAFDGRFRTCYPQAVIDAYFDFALGNLGPEYRHRDPRTGRYDDDKIMSLSTPPHSAADLVLLSKWLPLAQQIMREKGEEWVLLYQDDVAELWGRSDLYDDPDRPEFIPHSQRELNGARQHGTVSWPALPGQRLKSSHTASSL